MRWCYDKRVLIGLSAVVGVVLLLRPSWTLPVLVAALALSCPLSMIVMMRSVSGNAHCATDAAPAAGSSPEGDELAKLRAEVADLKAQQAQRAKARHQPD